MLRRLLADSALYTIASAIPGILALGLLPIYTRFLRPEDYGIVDLITLAYTVVTTIATLEIAQGLARHLPEAGNGPDRRRLSSTAFWFTVVTLGLVVGVLELTAPWIAPLVLPGGEGVGLFRLGGLTTLVVAAYTLVLRQLRWGLRPRAFLATTAVTSGVTAIVTLGLLEFGPAGPSSLLLGQGGGALVGLLLAWRLARGDLGTDWDPTAARAMLRFSLPLVVSTLGVLAAGQASRWVVAHAASVEAAGIFGIAVRIASVLGLAASGVQLSVGPLIYATHRQADTPGNLAATFRLFVAATVVLWSGLTLFAPEILRVFTAAEFHAATGLLGPIGAAVLLSTAITFAPGLEIRHRTVWVAIVSLLAGGLNLGLGWFWVRAVGASGAAYAMIVSAAAQAGLIFVLSQRHYPVPHRWGRLAFAVGAGLAVVQLPRLPALLSFPGDFWFVRALGWLALAVTCWFILLRSQAGSPTTTVDHDVTGRPSGSGTNRP